MNKFEFLLAAAFATLAAPSIAQTAPADSLVNYPITVQDARFVVAVLPQGTPVINTIAKAVEGITDSTVIVYVPVKQKEVILVADNNKDLQEGIAAEVNARLMSAALPLCAGRPWMAENLLAIRAANRAKYNQKAAAGARIIREELETWNR